MPGQKRKLRKDAGAPQTPFQSKVFRDFGGMNTKAKRQALAANEFAWLENVMPIGHGNAAILPGPSTPMASGWSGLVTGMKHFNRAGFNFMFIATTSGQAFEIALDFAGFTVASLVVTDPGFGYFRASNVTFIGAANVAAVATINITLIRALSLLNGSGYVVGDILTLTGGTFLRAAKVQVTSINGSGMPLTVAVIDGGDYSFGFGDSPVTGGSGTGAVIAAEPIYGNAGMGLGGTVTITNVGSGYQAEPTVSPTDGLLSSIFGPSIKVGVVSAIMTGSPHAVTQIGSGTPFSTVGLSIAQWKNERILIIDPNKGMFDWDGVKLTPPGSVFSITVTGGGSYSGVPSISFAGGGGAGAAASPLLGINGVQAVSAAGTNYVVGDILTLVGGTFTSAGQLKVTTIGGGGAITAVAVFNPGSYSALPAVAVSVTGGSGSGATFTPNYAVFAATITNTGTTAYTSAPTVTFGAAGTVLATGTANLVAAPTNPVQIEVFAKRVWIATADRKLWNSQPSTYNDFLSTGAGVTELIDPTLDSGVTDLFAANNYLYYTGVDNVNVIADVTVNANGNTVFSDTNLNASVGTIFSSTVIPYLRSTLFLNENGVYSIYGATPQKISDPMDGVFADIDFHGLVSAGAFTLNHNLTAAFLVLYNTSAQPSNAFNSRPLFMMFFDKKWFVANQDSLGRLISIAAGGAFDPNFSQNLYGTDGRSLYRLFVDPANMQTWKMTTAYWDMDALERTKQVTAFAFESDGSDGGTVAVSMDMVRDEPPYLTNLVYQVPLSDIIQWANNAGAIIAWINSAGSAIDWTDVGYLLDMEDADSFGKYVGVTLSSGNVTGVLSSIMLRYIYREDW